MSPKPRAQYYAPYTAASQVGPSPLVPAKFLPFLPHPGNRAPPCPPRPELPPVPSGWVRSFHAIPAAYPRQLKESHGPWSRESHPFRKGEPPANETKEERKARQVVEADRLIEARYHSTEWSLEDAKKAAPPGQFIAAERWRRVEPTGGATVVCTHANGTVKEHWHPIWHDLLAREPTSQGYQFGTTELLPSTTVAIDDIWMFDEANHSVSADLNAGKLGNAEIWTDLARDIVNFTVHVLPTAKAKTAAGEELPWQLEWAPEGAAPPVKIFGFGASFGGAAQAIAASYRPDAFEGVFLVDGMVAPRIFTLEMYRDHGMGPFLRVRDAMKRRDTWPSRQAARDAMGSTPFFQQWDPAMFDLYISHGLIPVDYANPDGPVQLATSPWCEAIVFSEPYESARGWDLLPNLRVPIGYLMAHDPERTLGADMTRELVWRAPLSRNEQAGRGGHLIMQETPESVADSAWRYLQTIRSGKWGSSPAEIRASYAPEKPKARL